MKMGTYFYLFLPSLVFTNFRLMESFKECLYFIFAIHNISRTFLVGIFSKVLSFLGEKTIPKYFISQGKWEFDAYLYLPPHTSYVISDHSSRQNLWFCLFVRVRVPWNGTSAVCFPSSFVFQVWYQWRG